VLFYSALDSITAFSRANGIDFDFVLFAGDMVDHSPIFITLAESIGEEEMVLKYLKQYFNNIPVFTVPGNHDTYPFAQMAQLSSGYSSPFSFNLDMATIAETLGWLNQAKNIKTRYGGYSVMVKDKLKIVALNSNFWYRRNFYNYWDAAELDSSGVFRFLANVLIECEQQGTRAWIIVIYPPVGSLMKLCPLLPKCWLE
jgi:sphingomyelin phosphodiesterase